MLIFNRKEFKSGVQVVKEPDKREGAHEHDVVTYIFKVSDKGHEFAFLDEAYILAKYPALFSKPA
jgi:hypothetical protein